MSAQETSLLERLCQVDSPANLCDWQDRNGYYVSACRVSRDDVPGLIDIMSKWGDDDWLESQSRRDVDSDCTELLPVTAWRTLADLGAKDAIEPLIELLRNWDDESDEWVCDDLPHVFGKIGLSTIAPLAQLVKNTNEDEYARGIAAAGLRCVARYYPDTRDQVVAVLTEQMAKADQGAIYFNSLVLYELVQLRAVEAAEQIERAFAGGWLDLGMMGNWEDVRRELGVEGLGLNVPENPLGADENFRRLAGIGIFSPQPIFKNGEFDGQVIDGATEAYLRRATKIFAESSEGQQVVQSRGSLAWFSMLLDFGIEYEGEHVDVMTLACVREFVLDYVPRKVSAESDEAADLLFELTKFWEFLDRVYQLPQAKSIVEWLKEDGLLSEVKEGMEDPENFDMAKALFMMGKRKGFDMTSEAGQHQFMLKFNETRGFSQPQRATTPPAGFGRKATEQRVGRNDPCPCGSGKKFKKCCLRGE